MKDNMKRLTEKLSAALVNVSAKEDLVKQHTKVAEEAVAGWEKAENEVAALTQQNSNLEARVSHLDEALKECVRQLRQGRDEQEKRIAKAIEEREKEWESDKAELEKQIRSSTDPKSLLLVESVEKENLSLKHELKSRCKELESVMIERDLSIQAAEAASKVQLESIKKVAKLEAECRKLQSLARKSTSANCLKPGATSLFYAESLTDSHSDSGDNRTSNVDNNGSEPSCSDSWASALIAELDQFKNEKLSLTACSVQIDMMDDFLEMERIAALPDTKSYTNTPFSSSSGESISMESNQLRVELDSMVQRVAELEKNLEKMEGEKNKLEKALHESEKSLKAAHDRMAKDEAKMEELQKEKELLESQLIGMEVESRTMKANVDILNVEVKKEQTLSAKLSAKCEELESGLIRSVDESLFKQSTSKPNGEVKIKQEDLAVAADKLAECQKTIASLGRQLQSLATLEDFLIDTSNIPGFSSKVRSNDEMLNDGNDSTATKERRSNVDESSVTSSANQVVAPKSKNGFGKFFSRSKSGVELGNRQD